MKAICGLLAGDLALVQTDTTAGFISTNADAINAAKGRKMGQICIKTFANLRDAKGYLRLSARAKNLARKARKTTIAQGGKSLRIVRECEHARLLEALSKAGIKGVYSSSANAHGAGFCADFALAKAQWVQVGDELLEASDERARASALQMREMAASRVLKIGRSRIKRLR